MALKLNTNIAALNAQRNLLITDAGLTQSIERLSSGFRINRAADDPAGLIISENLRAQVEGLGQAVANSADAVNLIKTAEGALNETSALLRSIRDLAVHASNVGVNDANALAADQQQIASAIASITRIAQTTQFNGRNLLDGSAGISGTSTDTSVSVVGGTAATKSGTYSIDITAVSTQAQSTVAANRQVQEVTAGAVTGANNIAGTDYGVLRFVVQDPTVAGADAGLGDKQVDIRVFTGDTIQNVIDRVNADSVLGGRVTAHLNAGGTTMVFTGKHLDGTAGNVTAQAMAGSGATGTAANVTTFTGVSNAAADASVSTNASASSLLARDETITLSDTITGRSVSVALQAGDSLANVASKLTSSARANNVNAQASVVDNSRLKLTNSVYGSSTVANVTFVSNVADATTSSLGINTVALTVGTAGGVYTSVVAGANVAGTINGSAATGRGQVLTGNSNNTDGTQGLQVKYTGTFTGVAVASVTVKQGSLTFQIGANAGQYTTQSLQSIEADKLGANATGLATSVTSLAAINVTTLDGAQDAIRVVDDAISTVSTRRADLGAFQRNILETNINSLGVTRENLQSSESTIRDTDTAGEILRFTKFQLQLQAGSAILAQANQTPQAVLALLR